MLIIGAKGFAKELLEVILQSDAKSQVFFFDDVDAEPPDRLFERYPVIRSLEDAEDYFVRFDNRFALGVGGPNARRRLCDKFQSIGGHLSTVVSPFAHLGILGTAIGDGSCLMTGTIVTSDVHIGRGCLLNLNSTVGHDSVLGDFCELSPGVHVSGHVIMGSECIIGTGSVLLPGVKLGDEVVVGAGAVVTKNVPSGSTVVGIPAKPLGLK